MKRFSLISLTVLGLGLTSQSFCASSSTQTATPLGEEGKRVLNTLRSKERTGLASRLENGDFSHILRALVDLPTTKVDVSKKPGHLRNKVWNTLDDMLNHGYLENGTALDFLNNRPAVSNYLLSNPPEEGRSLFKTRELVRIFNRQSKALEGLYQKEAFTGNTTTSRKEIISRLLDEGDEHFVDQLNLGIIYTGNHKNPPSYGPYNPEEIINKNNAESQILLIKHIEKVNEIVQTPEFIKRHPRGIDTQKAFDELIMEASSKKPITASNDLIKKIKEKNKELGEKLESGKYPYILKAFAKLPIDVDKTGRRLLLNDVLAAKGLLNVLNDFPDKANELLKDGRGYTIENMSEIRELMTKLRLGNSTFW